jgi:GTPase SAR1 family protein
MPAPDETTSSTAISLSLISHTNVGKTTLARTLLGRDIGEIRDSAHVTESADEHLLVETPQGERLVLWDTPGFGDSARLMKRLATSEDPIGRFLGDVWDRFRDRAFWSSQQAVRNVRDQADVVLYLVNASESPDEAGYVAAEMRVLEWIGKPVVVLLNQLGPPRAAQAEAAEVQTWRVHLSGFQQVRAVLPLDAFARCWVQEGALLHTLGPLLSDTRRPAMDRLVEQWLRRRREVFEASIEVLTARIARAASDRETIGEGGMLEMLRDTGSAMMPRSLQLRRRGASPAQAAPSSVRRVAMQRLAERLDTDIRASTDRLIVLHGLEGRASAEVLKRLAEHYVVKVQVSERKAAVLGGAVTGALTGLKADIATGGFTFGAGLLAGGVVGALGAFGLARGYNVVRGAKNSSIAWSDAMLDELVITALLGYLAVAHYGRGRGDWAPSEHPPHWRSVVAAVLERRREMFAHIWSLRSEPQASASITQALRPELGEAALEILDRLYPGARGSARPPGSAVHAGPSTGAGSS